MADAFRNIIQSSDTPAIKKYSDKILSISIRPDGVALIVFDSENYTYLAIEEYELPTNNHETISLEALTKLVQTNHLLNQTYKKTHITCFTPNLVLVPAKAYNPKQKDELYSFCVSVDESQEILADNLNNLNAFGLYGIPKDLSFFFKKTFPDHRLKHHGSLFIETTLAVFSIESLIADVVIHVNKTYFEILLIEKQKLKFYQSYHFLAFDDLLYYMLNVLEQHNMHANEKHIMIMGNLDMDSHEYEILSGFFKNVSFPERNDVFQYSKTFEEIPGHFYYTLINLVACG